MIIVLLVAAVVNFATVLLERAQGHNESFAECIIIVAVVLLNAILGVVQEGRAEKAIEALKQMTSATCKVIRDGKLCAVKSEQLVVGDIVVLEAGDSVPADCRIIEEASLKSEEAALTGESVPATKQAGVLTAADGKDVPLGDRKNMVYMGSTIVYGRAKVVVVATGMETEMGKIADVLAKTENEVTPLQKRLNKLSEILSFIVLGICVFIFAFKLLMEMDFHLEVVLESFIIAVSLAVAAIPEGLATVVTIVLSIGMTKMAKFMNQHIVLKDFRKADYIQIQIDIPFYRAAAPIGCIVFDGHPVICKSISGCQFRQTSGQLCLRLTAHSLDLGWRRHLHILIFLLLPGHCLQNPSATRLKEKLCSSIGHNVRHRHAHALDRMYTYADAPAPQTFAEHHLPYLGIHQNLS